MRWRKNVISGVQTQHWHLHRFQLVDRTGIVVIVVVGAVTKHDGGEPLIELSDGPSLKGARKTAFNSAFSLGSMNKIHELGVYLHDVIDVVTLFKHWSVSEEKSSRETVSVNLFKIRIKLGFAICRNNKDRFQRSRLCVPCKHGGMLAAGRR